MNKKISFIQKKLGLFSKAKRAKPVRMDVEKKVKFAQDKITTLKKKISMLPNE